MSPQEKQQFEQMKKELEELKRATNLDFVQNIKERIIRRIPTNANSSLYTGTENGTDDKLNDITTTDGGTITILGVPDNYIELTYNGTIYYIPAYK